jgi:hypothetical protein
MRNRLSVALAGVAFTLALSAPAHAATSIAGHVRYAIDRAADGADFSNASRDRFIVLQGYQTSLLSSIKAAHPGTKVLLYKDLSAMTERESGGVSTGVATQDAAAHPEWYLQNTSGARFTFGDYDWLWAADIGNASFQQKWSDNVLAELKQAPWDGVFMDDVNPSMANHYTVSAVARYPTDAAYSAATRSALASIGPRMHAASELLVANVGQWESYAPTISGWLQYIDGAMDEHFTKWSGGVGQNYQTGSDWALRLAEIREMEAQGKAFLGVSHSTNGDVAASRYGWATTLLVAAGNATFAMHGDYATENWIPEYDADLGTPSGDESALSSGVHQRVFSKGLVLVNPTTASKTVSFGGAYSGSGLSGATGTTMAPHTGLVLTKDVGLDPTPAPVAPAPAPDPTPSPAPAPTPTPAPAPAPVSVPGPVSVPPLAPAASVPSVPAPAPAPPAGGSGGSRPVKVTCHGPKRCNVRISLRSGKRSVGVRAVSLRGRSARTVTLALSAGARRELSRRGHLLVSITSRGAGRTSVAPRLLQA